MFRNFTLAPQPEAHDPLGALVAGIALAMLPLVSWLAGSPRAIEAGHWIPWFFGLVLLLHATAPLRRAGRSASRRGGAGGAP